MAVLTKSATWVTVALVAVLSVCIHWGRDFLAIDACLDAGHTFDYVEEVCDTEAEVHQVIAYGDRHPTVVRAGVGGAVLALAAAALAAGRERGARA